MKRNFTLSLIFLCSLLSFSSFATIWNVGVINNSFNPSSLPSVETGDTIRWTLGQGSHTTTSVSVPGGAATWNHTFTGLGDQFEYKVSVAGNYTYKCTIHGTAMSGSFTATDPLGVEEDEMDAIQIYPNPFANNLYIKAGSADEMILYSSLGQKIQSQKLTRGETNSIDLKDMKDGVYLCVLKKDGAIIETRRLVRR